MIELLMSDAYSICVPSLETIPECQESVADDQLSAESLNATRFELHSPNNTTGLP